MSDYDNAIFRLATETEPEPEDYTGEDGLLYCGSCRQLQGQERIHRPPLPLPSAYP